MKDASGLEPCILKNLVGVDPESGRRMEEMEMLRELFSRSIFCQMPFPLSSFVPIFLTRLLYLAVLHQFPSLRRKDLAYSDHLVHFTFSSLLPLQLPPILRS